MPKKPVVNSVSSTLNNVSVINDNFSNIRDAFDNTLSLDGSTPNQMGADLDMNSNDILNAGTIYIGGEDVVTLLETAETNASNSAAAAAASATNSANSASAAANSAALAEGFADALDIRITYATPTELISSLEAPRGEGSIWEAGGFRYEEAAADASDHHLTTAGGVKLNLRSDSVGRPIDGLGAVGDGSTDDTDAFSIAAMVGGTWTLRPGATYRLANVDFDVNDTRLICVGVCDLMKNDNGYVIGGSADRFRIEGVRVRGDTTAALPEGYTGDNISVTGSKFHFVRSASYWAAGRAIKSLGDETRIEEPIDSIATSDLSGSGYDIEIGTAGTATLYHHIDGWNANANTGGILFVDTGSHFLSDSEFGKLTIQRTVVLAGANGGMTKSCRIHRDIAVEQSNAVLIGNQLSSSNCNVSFSAGTSACTFLGNTEPASITNSGNLDNLIIRNGASGQLAAIFGDETNGVALRFSKFAPGTVSFPHYIHVPNGFGLRTQDSDGTVQALITMSGSDDVSVGTNNGSNFMNVLSGSGGIYMAPGGVATGQWHSGGLRPQNNAAVNLGTSTQRWFEVFTNYNRTNPTLVSSLPAAGNAGRRSFVTDATDTTFGSIVAGGGGNGVPVYDDGSAWRVG